MISDTPNLQYLFHILDNNSYTIHNLSFLKTQGIFPISPFMSEKLKKKSSKYNNILNISWSVHTKHNKHKINCKLNLYYSEKPKLNDKQLQIFIDCVSYILSFSKKQDDLIIDFIPLNDKKYIHKNQKNISRNNVNSGSSGGNHILIWRYEECLKVIIHECIHFLQFSNIYLDLTQHYNAKYKLHSHRINLNESYTEIFARIFYCFYLSNNKYHKFLTLLKSELNFSLIQANKMIYISKTSSNFLLVNVKKYQKYN